MRPRLRTWANWRALATALVVAAVAAPALWAQERLTLERIWASPEFSGEAFGPVRWLDDRSYTTVERSSTVQGGRDLVRYDARSGEREVMVAAERLVPRGADGPLPMEGYEWSEDGSRLLVFTNSVRVWRFNTMGDYWVLDVASGDLRQIGAGRPESSLMYAKFAPDGRRVGYVSENDLYVEDLETGAVTRLTSDGSRTILNGRFDWVYEEEFFLGSRAGADGWRWSPDGTKIAYWQLDASGVREFLLINNTDSLYSFTIPVQYPKAGTTNSSARLGIVPAAGGPTVWLRLEGDPRNNYIARMEWAGTGEAVVVQYLNRRQNTNLLALGDAVTGAITPILTETDEAWLDPVDDVFWFDTGRRFTWVSERDGWRRVYMANRDGSDLRPMTPANTDVVSVMMVDQRGTWLYYVASPENAGQMYLYRVRLDGRLRAERLTPADQAGWNGYQMSENASWAFHTHSTFDAPPVIALVRLPSHQVSRTMVDNTRLRDRVRAVRSGTTEFFRVDIGDGVTLDGWMMKPDDFDPTKKYPVFLNVYGHPWGQTVLDQWGGRGMLWHHFLTLQGYVVASLDNRGTPAPRGRAWRKAAYQEMGPLSAGDQAAGVRAMVRQFPFLDGDRIGIWGWSGGGCLTLDAMFRHPDVFHTGIAVASVPDYRNYDTIYQERYLGLPDEDADAYERNSPIHFAEGLRGNLLLVHGTGDDNVHYQGVEQLINELVRLNKPFSMMAYPNRSHGIYEGPGTTLHLYGLMTDYLLRHLPAGGR